jgi:hypothetical protein
MPDWFDEDGELGCQRRLMDLALLCSIRASQRAMEGAQSTTP